MTKHHVTTYDELIDVVKEAVHELEYIAERGTVFQNDVESLVKKLVLRLYESKPRKDKKKCCHCPKGREIVFCGCECHKVTE